MCYIIEVGFCVKIIIQYSSIQISLSVSKGFIFFKRCSKTHYKCCVSQQRELIFTVFITMSNFPDSCRILIMIQLIAMCWPHFQAISFAVSSVITCPVHHCHNLPICVISCMNSITYRSPWTLQIFHSLSMSVLYVIRAMIIQRMHFMYFNLQWNHQCSWGTKVHGFEGNSCPRFYISTKRITNICLKVFLKLPRTWYQRNIVPTNQNNFRYPRTLTPTKIMTLQ